MKTILSFILTLFLGAPAFSAHVFAQNDFYLMDVLNAYSSRPVALKFMSQKQAGTEWGAQIDSCARAGTKVKWLSPARNQVYKLPSVYRFRFKDNSRHIWAVLYYSPFKTEQAFVGWVFPDDKNRVTVYLYEWVHLTHGTLIITDFVTEWKYNDW